MRNITHIFLALAGLIIFSSCSGDKYDATPNGSSDNEKPGEQPNIGAEIPEGYFEVVFSSLPTRAAIDANDTRISDLRYLLFNETTGAFITERRIITSAGSYKWPITAVRDTLPKANYIAVFVGNTEKTLFPSAPSASEVLVNYQNGYSSGRIVLPNAEFSNTSEYYMSKVTFSDTSSTPYIILQRIIGMLKVHRNFVDADDALNSLTENIFTELHWGDLITNQVNSTLPGTIRAALDRGPVGNLVYNVVPGGLDAIVNSLVLNLTQPITDALYEELLRQLVAQLGIAIAGNSNQNTLVERLGVLLNPWVGADANSAIVSLNNFPKSIDFNRNVIDVYPNIQKFAYKFTGSTNYDEKDILIKNFNGVFDIRKIDVARQGLVGGLVFDELVDGPLLLNGVFIDIEDPLVFTNQTNRRFESDYSFVDLGLDSYAIQSGGPQPLQVSVFLNTIPGLQDVIEGIPLLGPVVNLLVGGLLSATTPIEIKLSAINVPLLGVENLSLSGGWSVPTEY